MGVARTRGRLSRGAAEKSGREECARVGRYSERWVILQESEAFPMLFLKG